MQFKQRFHRTGRGKILAAALVASVSFAQATQAQNFTLGGINVVGNKRIETSTIQTYAGLEPGQSVSMGDLNAAYQRILDSGLFETVEMTPRGNQVVIEVKEYPTINRINFEGNQRLGDEVLSSLVQSRPRLVFNPKTAEADRAAIAKAMAQIIGRSDEIARLGQPVHFPVSGDENFTHSIFPGLGFFGRGVEYRPRTQYSRRVAIRG